MCGRYLIRRKTMKKLSDFLGLPFPEDFSEGEQNPGGKSIVIGGKERSFLTADWGYDNPYDTRLIINARSETIQDKPMFHDDFRFNRCAVPADIYYEWTSGKQKVGFYLDNRSFLMAAVYRQKTGYRQMVILTKEASEDIHHIHPRSPVMIPLRDLDAWLYDNDACFEIMQKPNPVFNYHTENN